MTYAQRLKIAWIGSVMLHTAVLISLGGWQPGTGLGPALRPEPIVLNLQPPEPLPVRQLVDTPVPAAETPDQTDLISDANAIATDDAIQPGQDPGPRPEVPDELDVLASRPEMPLEPAFRPPPVLSAQDAPGVSETVVPALQGPPPALDEPDAAPVAPPKILAEAVPAPAPSEPVEETPPERFEVAELTPPPAPDPVSEQALPRPSKGRLHDLVKKEGLTSYEALQDQIAPYLQEVRRHVERQWNAALLTRYSGTSPREVVIDCAIRPDGELAYVRIVGPQSDRIYAALCKDAIEKAAPFRRFPFRVPEMYRSRNLEIRWTFSFL